MLQSDGRLTSNRIGQGLLHRFTPSFDSSSNSRLVINGVVTTDFPVNWDSIALRAWNTHVSYDKLLDVNDFLVKDSRLMGGPNLLGLCPGLRPSRPAVCGNGEDPL